MLREAKTHMSNYTHAQTHTSDYCCVWTLPLKTACSAAFTHCGPLIHSFPLFSVSCWLCLSFPRQGQFPAGCRPAFVLSVSLSSLTWIFCKTETTCLSGPLKHFYIFFVIANKYYAHVHVTRHLQKKRLFSPFCSKAVWKRVTPQRWNATLRWHDRSRCVKSSMSPHGALLCMPS